ncbi:MAG: OsmC family peroxiredoxin [Weeksellaceae bacterium]|nr:OsmC family peroxiredoxin [Weeksellaceae bacterium]
MKKHNAQAVWYGSVKEGNGKISSRSKILDNTNYSFTTRFGDAAGTNPDELLAASHAGCFAMATSLMLGQEGFTPESLSANAEVTMNPETLTIESSHLTLKGKVPQISNEKFIEIATNASKNCPISTVLNCKITLDASLE